MESTWGCAVGITVKPLVKSNGERFYLTTNTSAKKDKCYYMKRNMVPCRNFSVDDGKICVLWSVMLRLLLYAYTYFVQLPIEQVIICLVWRDNDAIIPIVHHTCPNLLPRFLTNDWIVSFQLKLSINRFVEICYIV